MTWRDKSVTVDQSAQDLFKSVLGDVRVSERGIRRDHLKGLNHWTRIRATMSRSEIFEGFLDWEQVRDVEKKTGHLTYPHIDIIIDPEDTSHWDSSKLMIFFKDESPQGYDDMEACFKAIKKYWNAHRQKNKQNTMRYSYDTGGQPEASGKQQEERDEPELEEPGQDTEGEPAEQRQEDDGGSGLGDILNTAASKPKDLMDKFGS